MLADTDPRLWHHCTRCEDSGWSPWWCGEAKRQPWMEDRHCGRKRDHLGHEWAERCACWDTNPKLTRAREQAAERANSGNQRRAS